MRTTLAILITAALVGTACGGASVEAPPPEPVAATPAPVVQAPRPVNPYADVIWYVYWEGIHCLTIYPQPGLVRSELPDQANATFSSRNEHFSIISVYYEREDDWAPEIDAATGIDDLLSRLRRMDVVEVEEALNPVQSETY